MSESALRRRFNKILRDAGKDPHAIEDKLQCGVPDVNFIEGWCELKVAAGWPKRPGTRLALRHFTNHQRVWLVRRCRRGGRAFVFLRVGAREYLLFRGDVAARYLGNSPRDVLVAQALAHWPDGLVKEELVEWLCERPI